MTTPIPSDPVPFASIAAKGQTQAEVGVIEFAEFQCPYCAKFANDTMPRLLQDYVSTNRVRWTFRHFPLEGVHPLARGASEIAACAADTTQFWTLHDVFFKSSPVKDAAVYRELAMKSQMDQIKLNQCQQEGKAAASVDQDVALAKTLQIHSTPTFLVGRIVDGGLKVTQVINGARPIEDFRAAIDSALSSAKAGGF